MFMPNERNRLPENAAEIDPSSLYGETREFFSCPIAETEFRQVHIDPITCCDPMYKTKILWIDRTSGIGYALLQDWKRETIRCFRLGTEEAWRQHRRKLAAVMY